MKGKRQEQILKALSEHQQTEVAVLSSNTDILIPQTSFSSGDGYQCVHVFYISDIHLDYHLQAAGIALSDTKAVTFYIDNIIGQLLGSEELKSIFTKPANRDFYWSELEEKYGEKKADDLFGQIISEKNIDQTDLPKFIHHCVVFDGDISENINLTKIFFERFIHSLGVESHCRIFMILGNHEYHEFADEDSAVKAYKEMLSPYNVWVLNNEVLEFENCYILGGTGFAKYNEKYNANTLICSKRMQGNRAIEAEETEKFFAVYTDALKRAEESHKPVIVCSHYPVRDWLQGKLNNHCFYFTGHNHNNEVIINERFQIYADNQIGYKNNIIRFKEAHLGTLFNPFIDYSDGVYQITPNQYRDFYLYNGESIGVGIIQKKVEAGSPLYMIKRNGFYGFFIKDKHGMKICSGGRVKNINSITDIEYFDKGFIYVVSFLVNSILPYYKVQQIIADEIKQLHLPFDKAGQIHGCIIDIDFFHHIMINPFDGKITFYYSPVWGIVEPFSSMEQLLMSVEKKNNLIGQSEEYFENKEAILTNQKFLISKTGEELTEFVGEMTVVDLKNSLYTVSNKMKQYQRLFTANILREWNDSIIENYLQIGDINLEYGMIKEPTPYKMVNNNWQKLITVDSSDITPAMIKSILNPKRKCPFPYQSYEKYGNRYYPYNPISDEKITEYIHHIPERLLIDFFQDFLEVLGLKIILYYPLNILTSKEFKLIPDYCQVSNKALIETISLIPEAEWTQEFGNFVGNMITLKRRPKYCEIQLWNRIKSYS